MLPAFESVVFPNIARGPNVLRTPLDAEPEAVKLVEGMSNQYSRGRMLEQLRQELAKVPWH